MKINKRKLADCGNGQGLEREDHQVKEDRTDTGAQ